MRSLTSYALFAYIIMKKYSSLLLLGVFIQVCLNATDTTLIVKILLPV